MGMAHRGRLNVLANFLKKSLKVVFTEFSENYVPNLVAGDGDVKYHLGYRTVRKLASGSEVEIRLSANPSHLEAVDPVVEGTARARQRIRRDTEHRRKVLPLLLHGDAAFAGQGIVAETFNMSQLAAEALTTAAVSINRHESNRFVLLIIPILPLFRVFWPYRRHDHTHTDRRVAKVASATIDCPAAANESLRASILIVSPASICRHVPHLRGEAGTNVLRLC